MDRNRTGGNLQRSTTSLYGRWGEDGAWRTPTRPTPPPERGRGIVDICKGGVGEMYGRLLADFPDFPNFAGQAGAGFEGLLAGFPAGRCDFTGGAHMLEGLNLADGFLDSASYAGGEDFHGLNDEIGINDETTADVDAGHGIVDAINGANAATLITQHGEGETALHHFGEFFFLPNFMCETTISTDGKDLNP